MTSAPSRGQIWFGALSASTAASQTASKPVAQPASQTASQPVAQPVAKAGLQPGAQPALRTASRTLPPASQSGPIRCADAPLGNAIARFLAVVPDPQNRFPRATENVVGLEQGWLLARAVREALDADRDTPVKRPLIAIVDVQSQAYGRREELLGVHLACAAAVDAYASARLAGHPVIALIVGPAMSGAYLAHGYQANRILALDAPGTSVHAMGKEAAARVTRRSVEGLDALGDTVLPMSYKMSAYAKLGLLHELIEGVDADTPGQAGIERVRRALIAAIEDARRGPNDLSSRLQSPKARHLRAASIEVRKRLAEQWNAP